MLKSLFLIERHRETGKWTLIVKWCFEEQKSFQEKNVVLCLASRNLALAINSAQFSCVGKLLHWVIDIRLLKHRKASDSEVLVSNTLVSSATSGTTHAANAFPARRFVHRRLKRQDLIFLGIVTGNLLLLNRVDELLCSVPHELKV